MRALLIKGVSTYGVTPIFIDEVSMALQAAGWETVTLQVEDGAALFSILETVAGAAPFELVYSIGIFGERRDAAGRSVADVVGAPHVVQYVDYPLGSWKRLQLTPASTALLMVDPTHVDAVQSVYGRERFPYVGFSPHGGVGAPNTVEPDPQSFMAARPIPILFCGSFYKPKATPLWASLAPDLRRLFEDAYDLALSQEWLPALDAIDAALRARGRDPSDPDLERLRENAFAVHEQVRAYRRFELLKAVAKAGLALQVHGRGYEQDLYRFKTVRYGGEATIGETLELMKRSRVVLNINANFGEGSHERPLSAMLAGAAAASDFSTFYSENFRENDEILLYRWKALAAGVEALGQLADDPERVWAMAGAGQIKACAAHRWSHRLPAILAAAQAVSSMTPNTAPR